MPFNTTSDRQVLLANDSDDPPTYEDVTNPGTSLVFNDLRSLSADRLASSYGSFTDGSSRSNLQPPTVIVVGGCPSCKVCRFWAHDTFHQSLFT